MLMISGLELIKFLDRPASVLLQALEGIAGITRGDEIGG